MKLDIWTGQDYTSMDVPDTLLQPVCQYLVKNRYWDRDMDRLNRMVMNLRLDITDHLLQQAQHPARPTVQEEAEAERILAQVEAPEDAPSAAALWDAGGSGG